MTDCEVVEVNAVVLALTEATVKQSEVSALILPMFDLVYAWLRATPAAI